MIDLSQLTPNTTQPVALSTMQSSQVDEAPTLARLKLIWSLL